MVRAWTRLVRFPYLSALLIAREPNLTVRHLCLSDLRNKRSGVQICSEIVRTRTREISSVGHSEIPTHVGTDPVRNILLIHRVLINLVGSRTRHILRHGLDYRLDSESKLGHFATVLTLRVSEIKVTQDCVPVRRWRELGETSLFLPFSRSKCCFTSLLLTWVLGIILVGTDRVTFLLLDQLLLFVSLRAWEHSQSLNSRWLDNLVCPRSRHTIIG